MTAARIARTLSTAAAVFPWVGLVGGLAATPAYPYLGMWVVLANAAFIVTRPGRGE